MLRFLKQKQTKKIRVNDKEKVMVKKDKKSLTQFKNVQNSAAQGIFLYFLKYLILKCYSQSQRQISQKPGLTFKKVKK